MRSTVAIILLTLCAVAAVMSTWRVFSQTADEPIHIACGMEWLAGKYEYEYQHPPLARVLEAIGPYAIGLRYRNAGDPTLEGNLLLHARDYQRTLSLARAGTLPFLVLSVVVVALWTRRDHGDVAAVLAVLLFLTLPPILAHSGVATTDMAAASTIAAAAYAFRRWMEQPTLVRAAVLGVAIAAALLAKLSSVAYLPPLLLLIWFLSRRDAAPARRFHGAIVAALTCFLVIWAIFRFSFAPVLIQKVTQYDQGIPERLRPLAHRLGKIPIPAPEMLRGIGELARHAADGHPAYLRGEYRRHGWIQYFPITLLIKTPLAILLLALAAFLVFWGDRARLIAPVAAIVVLLVAMTSSINIGIRHILPLYPFLAIAAAGTAGALWRAKNIAVRGVVVLLIAWQCTNAAMAHPDHLAWFNEIADDRPEAWLLDSNIDWGQDLIRLRDEVRRRGIDSLALSYFGSADPSMHGFPPLRYLDPDLPTAGWAAVSLMNRYSVIERKDRAFRWLDPYVPDKVGHSILLYRVPATALTQGLDTILIPILIGPEPLRTPKGAEYVTDAVLRSTHRRPITITMGPEVTVVQPGEHRPRQLSRTAVGGNLIRVPIPFADAISVEVTLRDLRSDHRQTVPITRARDVGAGSKEVVLNPGVFSRTIRIYDLGGTVYGTARVTVLRGDTVVAAKTVKVGRVEPGGPAYSELDLSSLGIRDGRDLRVRVEPGDQSMRLWPLLMETEPDTEKIRFTPPLPAGEGKPQKPTR